MVISKEAITIRKAVVEDAKKLSILYKQVYIKTYDLEGVSDEFANFSIKQFSVTRIKDCIIKTPDSMIMAEYKNNLVGVLELTFNNPCPLNKSYITEVNKLYILEWFCGMGIGEKLYKEAEIILRKNNEDQLWLWLLDSNSRALNFYKKQGFKTIGEAPFRMETNTYNNIVMLKKL